MIAFIKGKVIDEFEGGVVLENNGIGYEILCSAALLAKLSAEKEGGVFTYLQVKEDGLSLFGFDNKEEKRMFLKLISVSGIGPKMAMGILSGMRVNELATAIAMNDVKGLSRIKGLGKKDRGEDNSRTSRERFCGKRGYRGGRIVRRARIHLGGRGRDYRSHGAGLFRNSEQKRRENG